MPTKPPVGSITSYSNYGDRWMVCVPVDRDRETGKLIYLRKLIRGPKRDAEAYRAEMVELSAKRTAPMERPPRLPKQRSLKPRIRIPGPTNYEIARAIRVGVAGRPPVWMWSDGDLRSRFYPSKVTDAELVALWRVGRPRRQVDRYVISRGLWRKALDSYEKDEKVRSFIAVVERGLESTDDMPRGLKTQCAAIAESGALAFLRAELREINGRAFSPFETPPGPVAIKVPEEILLA